MPRSRGVRNYERETGNKTGKHPESEKEMFQNEIQSGCRSNLILKIQKKKFKKKIQKFQYLLEPIFLPA